MEIFTQTLGWIGSLLFIIAYLLVSLKKVDSTSLSYQLLNFLGSIGLGTSVFYQRAWPAFALEVVWGSIAIFTLARGRKQTG